VQGKTLPDPALSIQTGSAEQMRRKNIYYGLASAVVIGGMLGSAVAHNGETGIVGARMMGMMNMSRSLKELSETLDKPSPDPSIIDSAGRTIREHAGTAMTSLFPDGSIEGSSEATYAIWENWEEFSQLAAYLQKLGDDLIQATEAPIVKAPVGVASTTVPSPRRGGLWASLDAREMLGLDPVITPAANRAEAQLDRSPSVREIFGAITNACSECHSKYRQAGR